MMKLTFSTTHHFSYDACAYAYACVSPSYVSCVTFRRLSWRHRNEDAYDS